MFSYSGCIPHAVQKEIIRKFEEIVQIGFWSYQNSKDPKKIKNILFLFPNGCNIIIYFTSSHEVFYNYFDCVNLFAVLTF